MTFSLRSGAQLAAVGCCWLFACCASVGDCLIILWVVVGLVLLFGLVGYLVFCWVGVGHEALVYGWVVWVIG